MGKFSFEEVNELYVDVLREIGNIGSGNATTAIASMLDLRLNMNVPKVELLSFQEFGSAISAEDETIVGIYLGLEQDIEGSMMFLMKLDSAHYLVNKLMGRPADYAEDFDEMDMSASVILQDKYHISSVYNINYNGAVQEEYAGDCYIADEEEEDKIPITAAEIYMGYPDKLEKLMAECDMDISEYDKRVFGDYVVLIRR